MLELLEAVRPAAMVQTWEFTPQNLANTAWAFATLGVETLSCWRRCRLPLIFVGVWRRVCVREREFDFLYSDVCMFVRKSGRRGEVENLVRIGRIRELLRA